MEDYLIQYFSIVKVPRVLWAQRKDIIYLTFEVVEAQKETLDVNATSVRFSALQGSSGDKYAVEFDLYAEVDPAETKKNKTDRKYSVVLKKADEDKPFWPRLVKSGKPHFVHTDFALWKEEDDEEDLSGLAGQDMDFSQFASLAGAGMGGNFGAAGPNDYEEEEEEEEAHEDVEEDPYQKTSSAALRGEADSN